MPSKKRRSSSRRWNSWIEATIKLTVLAARFCKYPEKVYEYNPEPCISYVHYDEDKLHIKLKEFDEMLLEE